MSAPTIVIDAGFVSGMLYGLLACVIYDLFGLAVLHIRHAIERRSIQRRKRGHS